VETFTAKGAESMDNATYSRIVSFIWGIADDCLRDVYVRGKYRDVILPMTVIRRLDAVLENTKPEIIKMKNSSMMPVLSTRPAL
jgi:type I restriction enzyme M protein